MKLKYIAAILPFVALLLCGCSDFLDVQPKDKQTQEQLFSSQSGFYVAVNGVYNNLASNSLYGRQMSWEMIELLGRRYTFANSTNTYFSSLNATSADYSNSSVATALANVWRTAYTTILNCNVILDNIERQDGILSEKEAAIMKGEMLAARALLHFDILRLFGPSYSESNAEVEAIPYNESSKITALPFLTARSVIEDKILRDLNDAIGLLAERDPVITDGPMASDPGENEKVYLRYRQLRFNYYSVLALKARVLLYAGDKTHALAAARTLLDDPAVHTHFPPVDPNKLLANNTNPDRIFSTEVLMGVYKKDRVDIYKNYFDSDNANVYYFIQPRDYVTTSLFAGETQDFRFQSQWQTVTSPGKVGHSFIKYKGIDKPVDSDVDYFYATMISLIRLSEMYYIAAESETELDEGYKWLNRIRELRGLPSVAATSQSDLMTRLRFEYIREFSGEGQVFFLYKRLWITMPSAENGSVASNIGATVARYVPPIPAGELENR